MPGGWTYDPSASSLLPGPCKAVGEANGGGFHMTPAQALAGTETPTWPDGPWATRPVPAVTSAEQVVRDQPASRGRDHQSPAQSCLGFETRAGWKLQPPVPPRGAHPLCPPAQAWLSCKGCWESCNPASCPFSFCTYVYGAGGGELKKPRYPCKSVTAVTNLLVRQQGPEVGVGGPGLRALGF